MFSKYEYIIITNRYVNKLYIFNKPLPPPKQQYEHDSSLLYGYRLPLQLQPPHRDNVWATYRVRQIIKNVPKRRLLLINKITEFRVIFSLYVQFFFS